MSYGPALDRRIRQTVACRDTEAIPKVDQAGAIVTHDGRPVQVMHNGVIVEAGGHYGDWMSEIIRRLRGHHEPQEEAAFHAVTQRIVADTEAPVMVELGSYWAYYTLWLHRLAPYARLVCVEPDPVYLAVGRRNAALNGAAPSFVRAALGPDGEQTDFCCESDGVTRATPLVALSALADREGLARVDLVLCDTQGSEFTMLEGAHALWAAGRLRFVVVSTHHHSISGDPLMHQRCLDAITDWGGHVIAEHTVYESASGDGLIVASFDPRDRDMAVALTHVRARDSLFGEPEYELAAARDRAG